MVVVYLNSGGILVREGKVAVSNECCCGCCCKDGEIDRSIKFQKPCEDAGGAWGPCPSADICSCQCDPSATVNGIAVAPGDPADDASYTAVGTEAVTIPLGGSNAQWRFSALSQSFCVDQRPVGGGIFYVLAVTIRVELWLDNGTTYYNYTAGLGSAGFQAYTWEFLFQQQAGFDDTPNSWPCAKPTPSLLNVSPIGPNTSAVAAYFGSFGINFADPASDGWEAEYEDAVDAYLADPVVSLDCSFTPACE